MKLMGTLRRTGILGLLMLAGGTVGCDIVGPRAQSGSFQDTTSNATPDGRVFLVPERPGMYDLIIDVDGFREWTRTDIVVRTDAYRCHVVTECVVADLEPDFVEGP